MSSDVRWARRVLWAQAASTVAALLLLAMTAAVSLLLMRDDMFGPAVDMMTSPFWSTVPLLLFAAIIGFTAVRRRRWWLGTGIVLLAPPSLTLLAAVGFLSVLTVASPSLIGGSGLYGGEGIPVVGSDQDVVVETMSWYATSREPLLESFDLVLQVFAAAHIAGFLAQCLAAVAGVLLIRAAYRQRSR